MSSSPAGEKIHSQALYLRQKNTAPVTCPAIIADNLRTPANIASIFRLADAVAAQQIFFLHDNDNNSDSTPEHNKTIQKLSRHTTTIETCYYSRDQFLSRFQSQSPLVAIELTDKASNVYTTRLPEHCSFVIGSERHGVSDIILKHCDSAVCIPMFGSNGSMNVSHALALCLYEWHRQHTPELTKSLTGD